MIELQRQVNVADLVGALALREERNKQVLGQIEQVRQVLIEAEAVATADSNLPMRFAATVLKAGVDSSNTDAKNFALAFVNHLSGGEPASEFLAKHPEFSKLDLTWLLTSCPEVASVLEPIIDVNLPELLDTGATNIFFQKEIKFKEISVRNDKPVTVYETKTVISDVMDAFPVVDDLFGGKSGLWVSHQDTTYLSLQNLCTIFERVEPIANKEKESLAIYQAVTAKVEGSLMAQFFVSHPQYSREKDLIRVDNSLNKFCSRDLARDFVVYCADVLGSAKSRSKIRIKGGEVKKAVKEIPKESPSVESFLVDKGVREWTEEELIGFFETEPGKALLSKVRDKDEISSKLVHINNIFPAARFLLEENMRSFYWRPGRDKHLRTLRENLTIMISTNGRQLNPEEQLEFFEKNITTLWKIVSDQTPGASIDGFEGLYLSRDEYINGLYLLSELFKVKELNHSNLAVIQERENIKPKMPVSKDKLMKQKNK